jgi:hypothetical protein
MRADLVRPRGRTSPSDVVRIVGLGDEEVTADELPLTPRMETIVQLSEAEA